VYAVCAPFARVNVYEHATTLHVATTGEDDAFVLETVDFIADTLLRIDGPADNLFFAVKLYDRIIAITSAPRGENHNDTMVARLKTVNVLQIGGNENVREAVS
jgi:hypothetical protein